MVRPQSVIAAAALEDFPETGLDFAPSPDVRTFREAARHIPATGDGLVRALLAAFALQTAEFFGGMRMKGMVPATTRRRLAAQAGR